MTDISSAYGYSRLPPHGGSGLKFLGERDIDSLIESPSPRREWIEIEHRDIQSQQVSTVSLPTEGVD